MEKIFKALGDLNRLRIALILERGPLSVGEITRVLGLSQSNVSHHLKKLTEAGVVYRRGERGWVFYGINPGEPAVADIVGVITARREAVTASEADFRRLSALYRDRRSRSREFFAALGDRWAVVRESLPPPENYMEKLAGALGTPDSLLEVGIGAGHMIPFLCRVARRVVGVDNSPEMLSEAAATASSLGLASRVETRLGEAEHLPLGDFSVDAVLMHFMLHHAGNPREALAEAGRVLSQGGILVVVEFTGPSTDSFRHRHGDLWPGFTRDELTAWCRPAGLLPQGPVEPKDKSMMISVYRKGENHAL
jgi:ArsR family transcriptional regulator